MEAQAKLRVQAKGAVIVQDMVLLLLSSVYRQLPSVEQNLFRLLVHHLQELGQIAVLKLPTPPQGARQVIASAQGQNRNGWVFQLPVVDVTGFEVVDHGRDRAISAPDDDFEVLYVLENFDVPEPVLQ